MKTIRKSWWRRIQLFLIGTLVFIFTQSSCGIVRQQFQADKPKVVSSECRTVEHQLGKTCIPLHPKRVIVMDQESLEILVALGINPIASTIANRVGSKLEILQEKTGEIVNLGKEGQPNLEKIVELRPDLIVGMFILPQNYSLLSQIAPTVSIEYSQTGWKQTLKQVAEIVDKVQESKQLLDDYQQKIARFREAFLQKTGKLEICIMRFYTTLQFTQFLNQNSFTVSVMEELGVLSIPEIQRQQIQIPNSDYGYINTSLEQVYLLEADKMFIALDPGAKSNLEVYENSPLWQTLNVVKQNQVYIVDSGYWIFGNILSANAILDDLFKYLVKNEN
ncbi:iron-siderophore ABC transporter substrate-binding protein [[Phormidium ambiguum] IAM M-71]|uniref:iron-siderophore ABC transporter substrate-binding protein n=1 Tax=[Phormidium ambiguum] IAM M-71 TaxID=454136 RepID=UPI0009FD22E8|nr:iron-siderophore ABC transporter substrate-binding protein [Phormidium ambiguum]